MELMDKILAAAEGIENGAQIEDYMTRDEVADAILLLAAVYNESEDTTH